MTRDPQIHRIEDELGMTDREAANRAITAGTALAVILAVAAAVAVVVAAFWLLA